MNTRKVICASLPVLLALTLLTPAGQAQRKRQRRPIPPRELKPREVAALLVPATVSIYTLTNEGEAYVGAGFFVTPTSIATCYHVIEDADIIRVKLDNPLRRDGVVGAKDIIRAEVQKIDPENDLAILSVSQARGKPLKLFTGEDLYVGEAVYTIGNPHGMEGTFSNGLISNFVMHENGSRAIQFTAPVSPGSSGGPLVNGRGEVLGVVNQQYGSGQNLNFAVFYFYIHSLMVGIPASELYPEIYSDSNMEPPKPRSKRP